MEDRNNTKNRFPGWRLRPVLVLYALLVGTLPSCTTYNGVAEFSNYKDAYVAAANIGGSVLDRLAVSERNLYNVAYPFDPNLSKFDPAMASYLVEFVDPPATAAYRRTLRAVQVYNDALYGLASGERAAAIAGKITQLSAIGAGAAIDVAALAGAGPASGVTAVVAATTVNTVLAGLEPLTAQFFAFETRSVFREQLLKQAPIIQKAIKEVLLSTEKVFGMLRANVIVVASRDPNRTVMTDSEVAQIRRDRHLMAIWTVLLYAVLDSLNEAIASVQSDMGAGGFDGILLASEKLTGAVNMARLNLAGGE